MAEIPSVEAGGLVESEYANEIRDRVWMRYPTATDRDTSEPTPDGGELAILTDPPAIAQVFTTAGDDAGWETVITSEGGHVQSGSTIQFGGQGVSPSAMLYDTQQPLFPNDHWLAGAAIGTTKAFRLVITDGDTYPEWQEAADVGLSPKILGAPYMVVSVMAGELVRFGRDSLFGPIKEQHTVDGNVVVTDAGADVLRSVTFHRAGRNVALSLTAGGANWNWNTSTADLGFRFLPGLELVLQVQSTGTRAGGTAMRDLADNQGPASAYVRNVSLVSVPGANIPPPDTQGSDGDVQAHVLATPYEAGQQPQSNLQFGIWVKISGTWRQIRQVWGPNALYSYAGYFVKIDGSWNLSRGVLLSTGPGTGGNLYVKHNGSPQGWRRVWTAAQ